MKRDFILDLVHDCTTFKRIRKRGLTLRFAQYRELQNLHPVDRNDNIDYKRQYVKVTHSQQIPF